MKRVPMISLYLYPPDTYRNPYGSIEDGRSKRVNKLSLWLSVSSPINRRRHRATADRYTANGIKT
ncbi:MAG: hypothetical protein LBL07_13395 [Tannerella sp.]|nr:hypothetical protein [Tannerella sp.]